MQLALKLILRQETLAREVLASNITEIAAQDFLIFSSRVMLLLTQVLAAMAPASAWLYLQVASTQSLFHVSETRRFNRNETN